MLASYSTDAFRFRLLGRSRIHSQCCIRIPRYSNQDRVSKDLETARNIIDVNNEEP